jgi:hypothetical protein
VDVVLGPGVIKGGREKYFSAFLMVRKQRANLVTAASWAAEWEGSVAGHQVGRHWKAGVKTDLSG